MQYPLKSTWAFFVLAVASSTLIASNASADGTLAGTAVVNSVDLDYEVAGGTQTTVSDSVSFTVDRKLSVLVSNPNGATPTTVTVGQNQASGDLLPALTFDVTNQSNAEIGLKLAVVATGSTGSWIATNVALFEAVSYTHLTLPTSFLV